MDFLFDPSLVLYLPLYELDGDSFKSKDAHGHLCTVTGALWRPDGHYFDGTDDRLELPSGLVEWLEVNSTTGTILAWINSEEDNVSTAHIMASSNKDTTFTSVLSFDIVSGKLYARYRYKSVDKWTLDTDNNISDENNPLFIGVTHNGTAPELFVDGQAPPQTFSVTTDKTLWWAGLAGRLISITVGAGESTIGVYQNFYNGLISEFWMFNRVLSPLEIQLIYLATKWRYR